MDYAETVQTGAYLIFLWLGFGVVVGMVASIFLPEGEPKGIFGVLVVGVAGSCFGPLGVSIFLNVERFNPISPLGFLSAVSASLMLLLGYRFICVLWKGGSSGNG